MSARQQRLVARQHVGKRTRIAATLLLVLAVCVAPVALAQIADPTQPPPQALLYPDSAAAPAVPAGPQLQSLLVSRQPGGRRLAVIDGETVRVGGKVGGAVLVKITDKEAVLRRGKTLQVLTLFPAATPTAAPAPAASPKQPITVKQ